MENSYSNFPVAIVTGGNRGIGATIVKALIQAGTRVAIVSRSGGETKNPNLYKYYQCDIAHPGDVEEIVAKIKNDFGQIDILVNNAGINEDYIFSRMSYDQMKHVLDVNLLAPMWLSRLVFPYIRKSARGRFIFISSIVGIIGNSGQENYAASKAGLLGLSRSLAKEARGKSFTSNVIIPGIINAGMAKELIEQKGDKYIPRIPLGRFGTSEDIANLVVTLCGETGDYITGQEITVDGGYTLCYP